MKQPAPKTLIFDIETSPTVVATYGIHEQHVTYDNVIREWFMICAAWQWEGSTKVNAVSLLDDEKRFKKDPFDDYHVVKTMHDILSEAEVIVGHNMQGFDWKKLVARMIYHKLPPLNPPKIIDTLKEARKFKFTSNKLSSLCKHLGLELKQEHAKDMWLRILKGETAAVKEAVKYCKGDISATVALYLRLRPYMASSVVNHNLWRGDGIECCPKCGGVHIVSRGFRLTTSGKYKRYQCQDCGAWCQGNKSVKRVSIK